MAELFVLMIIGIVDLCRWFVRISFKIIFKIFHFTFAILKLIIVFIFGGSNEHAENKKPDYSIKNKYEPIDWDHTDEYVMYDEILYDEDE